MRYTLKNEEIDFTSSQDDEKKHHVQSSSESVNAAVLFVPDFNQAAEDKDDYSSEKIFSQKFDLESAIQQSRNLNLRQEKAFSLNLISASQMDILTQQETVQKNANDKR